MRILLCGTLTAVKYFNVEGLSKIIEKLNAIINTSEPYICITRPRRFGKSSIADMFIKKKNSNA